MEIFLPYDYEIEVETFEQCVKKMKPEGLSKHFLEWLNNQIDTNFKETEKDLFEHFSNDGGDDQWILYFLEFYFSDKFYSVEARENKYGDLYCIKFYEKKELLKTFKDIFGKEYLSKKAINFLVAEEV